ncbi:hypothetical protein HXX76_008369 [Chlamydomonas incerta]|uniref:Peptidase S8/S53 domain-containing protein n=1 Tax=Chlamydomonas incerta TaxID=51695 RepID=A0A835W126_CHLIN|nr:hypothetical protein HXX76_008369 [Chlamydomonas incerta]|eukprot:KAG2433303.1 hypothetical protein HXX76_008369 [Chlamydomonas incerta]
MLLRRAVAAGLRVLRPFPLPLVLLLCLARLLQLALAVQVAAAQQAAAAAGSQVLVGGSTADAGGRQRLSAPQLLLPKVMPAAAGDEARESYILVVRVRLARSRAVSSAACGGGWAAGCCGWNETVGYGGYGSVQVFKTEGPDPAAAPPRRRRQRHLLGAGYQQKQKEQRRLSTISEHERFQVDGRPDSVPADARSPSMLLWQLAEEAQRGLRAAATAAAAAAAAMAAAPFGGSSEGGAADGALPILGLLGGTGSRAPAGGHGAYLPLAHVLTMEQSSSGVDGVEAVVVGGGGAAATAGAAGPADAAATAGDGVRPPFTVAKTADPPVTTGRTATSQPPDAAAVDLRRYAAAAAAAMQPPDGPAAAAAGAAAGPPAVGQPLLQPLLREVPVDVALWHLDRIDQRAPPLDGLYGFGPGTGAGVTIYALDSGVYAEHDEFQRWGGGGDAAGRRASYGHDFVDGDADATDCDGHGTHVASTALGRSVGVARGAELVAVRVLDCSGSGSIADTVAGLDWLAQHVKRPAVAMLSLGVPAGDWSRVLGEAVAALVGQHGVPVVAASGNAAVDSCGITPANLPEVITVAASNLDGKFNASARRPPPPPPPGAAARLQLQQQPRADAGPAREPMYSWSNTGKCVDLFAPGVEIFGACGGKERCPAVTPSAYTWASGTSMAVPSVAGAAALYLELLAHCLLPRTRMQAHPDASPREVADALVRGATPGALHDPRMRPGTPNRLLLNYLGPEPLEASGVSAAEGPTGL